MHVDINLKSHEDISYIEIYRFYFEKYIDVNDVVERNEK